MRPIDARGIHFPWSCQHNSDLYFLGSGEAAGQGDLDVFIIQIEGALALLLDIKVILQNGALAKNIIWQASGAVNLGANSHMEGIILTKTAATMVTHSTLIGRIFAQTACTLAMPTITGPAL
jgi:hypothetical protein